jgi:hypothetical protein
MKRAEQTLAALWRAGSAGSLQREACLEASLAAVLEDPRVFPRLMDHLGWKVPSGMPEVTTQDRIDGGRTDIALKWENGHRLVIELKVGEAPGEVTTSLVSPHGNRYGDFDSTARRCLFHNSATCSKRWELPCTLPTKRYPA